MPTSGVRGSSARNAADRERLLASVTAAGAELALTPEVGIWAMELQRRLWAAHIGRAVGVFDLLIAAHALAHSTESLAVTVIHYDADYQHVADVEPSLRQAWIVPRGTTH
ncbi:MAG: hypothetical protein FWF28_07250 [Micrococcales bacterium]|nr:hypothetical protein [Micrococcales bacterium]